MSMQDFDVENFSIVIFASGNGSNAENIIQYAEKHQCFAVKAVFSNKKNPPVLQKARNMNIDAFSFERKEFYDSNQIKDQLEEMAPDLIVLAGFMWIFPKFIIDQFPKRVINIHPALLPHYGGKGMYGDHVHKAVLSNQEKQSGITIHYVNENYDEGQIIAQYKTNIHNQENIDSLKKKIQKLEHQYYPQVIHQLINQKNA